MSTPLTLAPCHQFANRRVNFAEPMVEKCTPATEERGMQIQSVFLLDSTLAACPRPSTVIKLCGRADKILIFPYHLENYVQTGDGHTPSSHSPG
jgi:hypothetical protein